MTALTSSLASDAVPAAALAAELVPSKPAANPETRGGQLACPDGGAGVACGQLLSAGSDLAHAGDVGVGPVGELAEPEAEGRDAVGELRRAGGSLGMHASETFWRTVALTCFLTSAVASARLSSTSDLILSTAVFHI